MTTLQIIALSLIGVGILVAIGFFILFVSEINKSEKSTETKEPEYFELNTEAEEAEVVEINIDEMLAKLEENAVQQSTEEVVLESQDNTEEVVEEQIKEVSDEEQSGSVASETVIAEEVIDELPVIEESVQEESVEELADASEVGDYKEVPQAEESKTTVIIKKIVKEGPEFDYRVRVEKIKESEEKLEKDLEKTEKAILKYERTERRLARNQKLLDRRAGELANLNLLMYNVTDIKNIDEDKKARQEELVAHISELKASIEDAEKYLSANADKHANNIKLRDYLKGEKVRYREELNELEILIAQAEGREPILTVETSVDTVVDDPDTEGDNISDDGDTNE